MKLFRLVMLAVTAWALLLNGAVVAAPASAPSAPVVFSISPNPAFPGETVTFTVEIDAMGSSGTYRLCFFSNGFSGQTYTFPGTVVAQDTWTLQPDATGCVGTGFRARYETDTNFGGDFGDTLIFDVTVGGSAPASTVTEAWRVRQYDSGTELTPNKLTNVQWIVATSVYVANDTGTCGLNSPCVIGSTALNRAMDGVTDPAGAGTPGTVTVLGTYSLGGSTTADLTAAKEVLVNGGAGASLNNSGACSNTMLQNFGGTLSVENLTLNGSCTSGARTAGVVNSSGNTTTVKNLTVQNFTGSGNAGIRADGGTVVVEGSTFAGNNAALDSNGGTLYAFANNVTTNLGLNAATNIDSSDNVKCNYWASYNVSGSDSVAQFEKRLGSPVSTYTEGAGALTLGRASLAAGTGNRVIVNLGRSTSNPPFNNGTVTGLGALTSDFFVTCLTRDGTTRGDLTIQADNVTPGTNGHRLYHVTTTTDCSPSTNTACWDYSGQSGTTAGVSLVDAIGNEGHYLIGNELDPTAITLRAFTGTNSTGDPNVWLFVALAAIGLLITGSVLRLRHARR